MQEDSELEVVDLDGSIEDADWIKLNSWDLPPYRSREFFAIVPREELEKFRKLPVYKGAVARGLIVDDEWVENCGEDHNSAFKKLGALAPGQHWSSFDVSMADARRGKANILVTTIWNKHKKADGSPELSIFADNNEPRVYWYECTEPSKSTRRHTWKAHWNRTQLAFERSIPIVGLLKDAETKKCSTRYLFDCVGRRWYNQNHKNGKGFYLELRPRDGVGCEIGQIDIASKTLGSQLLNPSKLEEEEERFQSHVQASMELDEANRLERITQAPEYPQPVEVRTLRYNRSPDIVAQVLIRAQGKCEVCHEAAPFIRRKDGRPYLEVHHRQRLADGGPDTLRNAIATCPNCHRRAHFG